jgi:purine-cytosine permease-like protein
MGGFKLAYIFILSALLYFGWFAASLAKSAKSGKKHDYKAWWLVIFSLVIAIGIVCVATDSDITDFIR